MFQVDEHIIERHILNWNSESQWCNLTCIHPTIDIDATFSGMPRNVFHPPKTTKVEEEEKATKQDEEEEDIHT